MTDTQYPSPQSIFTALQHDIVSPLAAIQAITAVASARAAVLTPAETSQYHQKIAAKTRLVHELLQAYEYYLALHAQALAWSTEHFSFTDLCKLLADTAADATNRRFQYSASTPIALTSDREKLQYALLVILEHAARCAVEKSPVVLEVRSTAREVFCTCTYTGERILARETALSSVAAFLPEITKERRFSLWIASELVIRGGGALTFKTNDAHSQQIIEIRLPLQ